MHGRALLFWLIAALAAGLCGCRTPSEAKSHSQPPTVTGTVLELPRDAIGSFRYYGELLIQSPARYRGKKVGLFVLSHEQDVSTQAGKDITFSCSDDELARSIEPGTDPFVISPPEPQISLECSDGVFHTIDYVSYEKPVSASGVVRSYVQEANGGGLYFQFDMGYSGDMASVEITTPAKYKGVVVHVLVFDQPHKRVLAKESWKKIGTKVSFSTSESTLAWEPWGFTPVDQLIALKID